MLHEVYQFSIALGKAMGRGSVSDIKSSKKTGIEITKCWALGRTVRLVQSYLYLRHVLEDKVTGLWVRLLPEHAGLVGYSLPTRSCGLNPSDYELCAIQFYRNVPNTWKGGDLGENITLFCGYTGKTGPSGNYKCKDEVRTMARVLKLDFYSILH